MDKRFRTPLLRVPHRTHYRVWSMRTITLVAIAVVTVTAVSVFLLGKGSLFRETGLTLAIVAAGLFLAVGLYRGVRVERWELPGVSVKAVGFAKGCDGEYESGR